MHLHISAQLRARKQLIREFRKNLIPNVLSGFTDLNRKADSIEADYYRKIGSMPAGEDEVDMSEVADDARDYADHWLEIMKNLKQSLINLLAIGLFHQLEQHLTTLSEDVQFHNPVNDSKIDIVSKWFKQTLEISFEEMDNWNLIEELRLVANTVKHGNGSSAHKLFEQNSNLFNHPDPVLQGLLSTREYTMSPLSGEDLYITEAILDSYCQAVENFIEGIASTIEFRKT